MTGTTRRRDSANRHFEKRVPSDVVERLRGKPFVFTFPQDAGGGPVTVVVTFSNRIRLSLRTENPSAWTIRAGLLTAHLETLYEAVRRGPVTLSQRQVVALSGEIYRLFVENFQDNPGSPDMWAAVKGFNRAAREGRAIPAVPHLATDTATEMQRIAERLGPSLTAGINALPQDAASASTVMEGRFGWLTDWVLATHGLVVDAESRANLIVATERASTEAALVLKRNATGDYTPDATADRFPPVDVVRQRAPAATGLTYASLFGDYKRNPGRTGARRPATLAEYERTFTVDLAAFVEKRSKHSDPSRVVLADLVAWRDSLLAGGLSPKTVRDKKFAAVKAVFSRAHRDGRINSNPAEGVEVIVPRRVSERARGFTDGEAATILRAASAFVPGRHSPYMAAAIRWVPWIGAYTGARVAEITQLRGVDIRQEDDGWFMRITPEAGATKSGQYRDVPLHPHLVDLGFPEWAKKSGNGPLFYAVDKPGQISVPKAKTVAGRVSDWVRKLVPDKRVQPTHGWRHRFKTLARQYGISEDAQSYILGHSVAGMGSVYGDMAGLHREIVKIKCQLGA